MGLIVMNISTEKPPAVNVYLALPEPRLHHKQQSRLPDPSERAVETNDLTAS